jgi:hypothetical protein
MLSQAAKPHSFGIARGAVDPPSIHETTLVCLRSRALPAACRNGGQNLADPVANAFTVTVEKGGCLAAGEVVTIAFPQDLSHTQALSHTQIFSLAHADNLAKADPDREAFSHTQTHSSGEARRRARQRRG